MPDQNPLPLSGVKGRRSATDWLDLLYDFERIYHRKPDSWRDLIYGTTRIPRFHARQMLSMASATSIAGAEHGDKRDRWFELQERVAGW